MFVVNTNVSKSDVPAALLSEATEELAKAMGKPAQVGQGHDYCCIIIYAHLDFSVKLKGLSTFIWIILMDLTSLFISV